MPGVHATSGRRRRSVSLTPQDLNRVRDWIEREIEFVDNTVFANKDAESKLKAMRPGSLDQPVESTKADPGIAFVSGLVQSPLLSRDEEVYLFLWMNFLKSRAEQLRHSLSLNQPDISVVEQVESLVAQAEQVRNQIVSSNLRLVVAIAAKLTRSMEEMSELIADASPSLIRAVELFDVSLQNRFSTYATWATRNQMLRCLKRRHRPHEHIVPGDRLLMLSDHRCIPEQENRLCRQQSVQVARLLTSLSDRERCIVQARFGLDGQPHGQSLQDIADHVGLSKERVRQVLIKSLEKLRKTAESAAALDGE